MDNFNYFQEENNNQIELVEEDFEKAFDRIFKNGELIHEGEDEHYEMEREIYYLQNTSNFIPKEETIQITKNWCDYSSMKKIFSYEDGLIDEKIHVGKSFEYENDKKRQSNTGIDINESEIKEYNVDEEQKIDLSQNELNKNKFRTYSSNDFNLFHPGGTVDYFKKIKEEINEEFFKKKKEVKKYQFIPKFKVFNEENKRNKKKQKEKRKRKDKPDDIRKKIKSRFLKVLKNRVNEKLKSVHSKIFFDFLPQCFVSNISKKANNAIINLTFKELMSKNFFENVNKPDNTNKIMLKRKRNPDKKKFENNIKVLEYLEYNHNICHKCNFNVIGNLRFSDIFNEYLKSEEFEKDILKLKNEHNNEKYIKDYIVKAYTFIDYFSKSI